MKNESITPALFGDKRPKSATIDSALIMACGTSYVAG